MKIKYILLILIITIKLPLYSQQPIDVLLDQSTELSAGFSEIYNIYNLDASALYFNDYSDKYKDTVDFKKSTLYKTKLIELKSLRDDMLSTKYYMKMKPEYNEVSFDSIRNGIQIIIGHNWGHGFLSSRSPKSISIGNTEILFPNLQSYQTPDSLIGVEFYSEKLFVPLNETKRKLFLENEPNLTVYYFFRIESIDTVQFKFYNIAQQTSFYVEKEPWIIIHKKVFKSDTVRIIVTDKEKEIIYFDKTYEPR
jgi:hypothetical protein